MGAVLLAAGAKGKRYALPHARVMLHQPWGGMQGTAVDINIHAKEILRIKERIEQILVRHTGRSLDDIKKDTDRDFFMTADDSKKYGVVDTVIEKIKK